MCPSRVIGVASHDWQGAMGKTGKGGLLGRGGSSNLRSLLARESLEDNLGVTVDFQVVDGRSIGGRAGAVGSLGQLLDELARGSCLPCDSLHCECVWGRMQK